MTTEITYAVQHPNMSHALLMTSGTPRTDRAVSAWASIYILKTFDQMLNVDEFIVVEVPADTDVEFSLFSEVES